MTVETYEDDLLTSKTVNGVKQGITMRWDEPMATRPARQLANHDWQLPPRPALCFSSTPNRRVFPNNILLSNQNLPCKLAHSQSSILPSNRVFTSNHRTSNCLWKHVCCANYWLKNKEKKKLNNFSGIIYFWVVILNVNSQIRLDASVLALIFV